MLAPVLVARAALVAGAAIKLLIALSLGTTDLFPQIPFEGCLLRLRWKKSVEYPDRAEIENNPQDKFADCPPAAVSLMDLAHTEIEPVPGTCTSGIAALAPDSSVTS